MLQGATVSPHLCQTQGNVCEQLLHHILCMHVCNQSKNTERHGGMSKTPSESLVYHFWCPMSLSCPVVPCVPLWWPMSLSHLVVTCVPLWCPMSLSHPIVPCVPLWCPMSPSYPVFPCVPLWCPMSLSHPVVPCGVYPGHCHTVSVGPPHASPSQKL